MAMDFFESQDKARRRTVLLVFYFLIAVVLIVLAVYAVLAAAFAHAHSYTGSGPPRSVRAASGTSAATWQQYWDPELFLWVGGGTLTVIILGSLYKIGTLAAGGERVARLLGGRPVNPETTDLNERMLLNVVEEMAIASGTPVPPVFVMDEERGINAFAAGLTTDNAVIGVTRGSIETLSRDELQGVIAHEFSHILNGDMRLNLRLMGVVYGILLIALIGYMVFRLSLGAGYHGRRARKQSGAVALILVGLALVVIGYIGVFFGKLIKSAVSRQREYLADSAAVQFTRNPSGLAGALKKIGGLVFRSRIHSPRAEEASHMFFGNALRSSFLNLMSTHPPLTDRIRKLDPSFDGAYPKVAPVQRTAKDLVAPATDHQKRQAESIRGRAPDRDRSRGRARTIPLTAAGAVSRIGAPGLEHLEYAAALVAALPQPLTGIARNPFGARALVYALLLDEDEASRRVQWERLAAEADPAVYQQTRKTAPQIEQLAREARLPLVDMALPALRNLSPAQYRSFHDNVRHLVQADKMITLFEYVLHRLLLEHLAPQFEKRKPRSIKYYAMRPLLPECAGLLSTLAYAGHKDAQAVARAFRLGVDELQAGKRPVDLLDKDRCGLKVVDRALDRLSAATPQIKKRVLAACSACIAADGRVTVEEIELLRAIADTLGCPMPPLLASVPDGG